MILKSDATSHKLEILPASVMEAERNKRLGLVGVNNDKLQVDNQGEHQKR